MIVYRGTGNHKQYKTHSIAGFDFIQSTTSAVKRPAAAPFALRKLTSENFEFLEKLGCKLKKKE